MTKGRATEDDARSAKTWKPSAMLCAGCRSIAHAVDNFRALRHFSPVAKPPGWRLRDVSNADFALWTQCRLCPPLDCTVWMHSPLLLPVAVLAGSMEHYACGAGARVVPDTLDGVCIEIVAEAWARCEMYGPFADCIRAHPIALQHFVAHHRRMSHKTAKPAIEIALSLHRRQLATAA